MDFFGVSESSALARENGGVLINDSKVDAQKFYQVVGSPQAGVGAYYVYSMTNVRLAEASLIQIAHSMDKVYKQCHYKC